MRRMRRDEFSRRMMRETQLTTADLIYPVFILEGERQREPVASSGCGSAGGAPGAVVEGCGAGAAAAPRRFGIAIANELKK